MDVATRLSRASVLSVILLAGGVAQAETSATIQAVLLVRLLGYDRNLTQRSSAAQATIAVVVQPGSSDSQSVQVALVAELQRLAQRATLAGRPLAVGTVVYSDADALQRELRRLDPVAVYLCPGLESEAANIVKVTQGLSVLSFAGSESYLDAGVSVGLIPRDNKTQVLINVASITSEKVDFNPEVFRVAKLRR